jgi:cryptochrome
MSKGEKVAIHWFRKGLRLHDNPALLEACKSSSVVYPLFVLDPKFCQGQMNVNRHSFLLECLSDLDSSLRSVGSRLFVVHGKPEEQLPLLVKKWKADLVTYESCSGPYSVDRDRKVANSLRELNRDIKISTHDTHNLFEASRYLDYAGKSPPKTYNAFGLLFDKMGPVRQPVPAPTSSDFKTSVSSMHDGDGGYRVPSLADIGYTSADVRILFLSILLTLSDVSLSFSLSLDLLLPVCLHHTTRI